MTTMKEMKVRKFEELKEVVENIDYYIANDMMIEYYNETGFRMKAKTLKTLIEEGSFKIQ